MTTASPTWLRAGWRRFITETYDTSPLPGRKLAVTDGRHAILVSDLYGNLSVWGNLD